MSALERRLGELQRACNDKGVPTILVFEGKVSPIHPPTGVEKMPEAWKQRAMKKRSQTNDPTFASCFMNRK